MEKKYRARIPFMYGTIVNKSSELDGKPRYLDRGEVITLRGYPKDQKLVALGYLVPLKDETVMTCDVCGRKFTADSYSQHKRKSDCWAEQTNILASDVAELLGVDYDRAKAYEDRDEAVFYDPQAITVTR